VFDAADIDHSTKIGACAHGTHGLQGLHVLHCLHGLHVLAAPAGRICPATFPPPPPHTHTHTRHTHPPTLPPRHDPHTRARAPADVFEFVLVFVVVHLLSPERAAALPPEIR
jgi:hypothetical protein